MTRFHADALTSLLLKEVNTRFPPTALMFGNIVTGCSIMAPAGMLNESAESLDVSIRTAGLLITFGAVVLCVGSPLTEKLAAPLPTFFSGGRSRRPLGCR